MSSPRFITMLAMRIFFLVPFPRCVSSARARKKSTSDDPATTAASFAFQLM